MKRWIQKGTSFSVKSICQMNASVAFFLDFAFEFGDLPFIAN